MSKYLKIKIPKQEDTDEAFVIRLLITAYKETDEYREFVCIVPKSFLYLSDGEIRGQVHVYEWHSGKISLAGQFNQEKESYWDELIVDSIAICDSIC